MSKSVVGFFDTYGEAADVVRDLELAGIVGEQVELVSAAEEEVPFGTGGEKSSSGTQNGKERRTTTMWRTRNSLQASHAEVGRR